MQSFMLSSKSAQFLEYMDLRTRTINSSSRSTDRDWTFGSTSSATESCHTGIHYRRTLSKLIQSWPSRSVSMLAMSGAFKADEASYLARHQQVTSNK